MPTLVKIKLDMFVEFITPPALVYSSGPRHFKKRVGLMVTAMKLILKTPIFRCTCATSSGFKYCIGILPFLYLLNITRLMSLFESPFSQALHVEHGTFGQKDSAKVSAFGPLKNWLNL